MTATEDLFTPIHKAIRSMIYGLGGRLQSNDFADLAASQSLLADLEHDFSAALSAGCILCIVHGHAADEEKEVFPPVSKFDPQIVARLIEEHHGFQRRLSAITTMSHELVAQGQPEDRIVAGRALNAEANEFFAVYLTHMNLEESVLVPMMKERFTDEQMAAMRGAIMQGMPPERLAAVLRWMLPALNLTEATSMLAAVKRTAPPPVRDVIRGIGAANVEPGRWKLIQERVGL